MDGHDLFRRLRFVDSLTMGINLLLLMITAFLPFPTRILAEALRQPQGTACTAVILYGATILLIELLLQAVVRCAASRPELTAGSASTSTANGPGRRVRSSPVAVLYALSIVLGIFFPKLAALVYLALAIVNAALLLKRDRTLVGVVVAR